MLYFKRALSQMLMCTWIAWRISLKIQFWFSSSWVRPRFPHFLTSIQVIPRCQSVDHFCGSRGSENQGWLDQGHTEPKCWDEADRGLWSYGASPSIPHQLELHSHCGIPSHSGSIQLESISILYLDIAHLTFFLNAHLYEAGLHLL